MFSQNHIRYEFIRYCAATIVQLVLSYAVYAFALTFAPWWGSYILALAVGLLFQNYLQVRYSFQRNLALKRNTIYLIYQLLYLAVFTISVGVAIAYDVPELLAPALIGAVLFPLNFMLARLIIKNV